MAERISYQDFKKLLDIRVGRVIKTEKLPRTEKLYRMKVDIGSGKHVQIISSLVDYYKQGELDGKTIIVLVNLEPAKFSGELSEGMLLAAESEKLGKLALLTLDREMSPGTPIT
jgi:methionine--tRNA ligase beta chain